MSKSKMKEVAQLLGVELGEEFKIKGFNGSFKLTNNGLYLTTYGSVEHTVLCNLLTGIREIEKSVLDKVEKEYLENFLRPFKDKIEYIIKKSDSNQKEHLYFSLYYDYISLPMFKKDTMYKRMKLNKEYTLKELGLFE